PDSRSSPHSESDFDLELGDLAAQPQTSTDNSLLDGLDGLDLDFEATETSPQAVADSEADFALNFADLPTANDPALLDDLDLDLSESSSPDLFDDADIPDPDRGFDPLLGAGLAAASLGIGGMFAASRAIAPLQKSKAVTLIHCSTRQPPSLSHPIQTASMG
ncbi:MAG: hypothetical protein HC936_18880, partial [Leptolyngbyaceae cyanobacterium SU_3_3]|nr:hypothetical protein [Leptolyngbyaceae cyanobacterium SU_3_3]